MSRTLIVPLLSREVVADQTWAFRFDLAGQEFPFQPGQYLRLAFAATPPAQEEQDSRLLSIASAPADPSLMIVLRMGGGEFKQRLAAATPGRQFAVAGPYGRFVLDDSTQPVALFAGGIGVTPFYSMIKHAIQSHLDRTICLVYCNRHPEDAAFLSQLQRWAEMRPTFRLLALMSQPATSRREWNGLSGRVDAAFARRHIEDLDQYVCYVAGSPRFVQGVTAALQQAGISREKVRLEEFSGY